MLDNFPYQVPYSYGNAHSYAHNGWVEGQQYAQPDAYGQYPQAGGYATYATQPAQPQHPTYTANGSVFVPQPAYAAPNNEPPLPPTHRSNKSVVNQPQAAPAARPPPPNSRSGTPIRRSNTMASVRSVTRSDNQAYSQNGHHRAAAQTPTSHAYSQLPQQPQGDANGKDKQQRTWSWLYMTTIDASSPSPVMPLAPLERREQPQPQITIQREGYRSRSNGRQ